MGSQGSGCTGQPGQCDAMAMTGELIEQAAGATGRSTSQGVGIAKSIFNFATLVIGGGLLGWPSIFKLCGWAGGAISLCVVCTLASSTMCLMVNCGIAYETLSYEETCCALWGRPGYFIVTVTCYLMDFGILVTYWVALGDLVAPLAQQLFGASDRVWIKLALAAFMILPCYVRNVSKVPGWSDINCMMILFALVTMLCLSFSSDFATFNRDEVEPRGVAVPDGVRALSDELWPSLGTLAFTFVNHDSVFTVYGALQDRTGRRWAVVCNAAMWSTVVLMLAVGLPIYLALGEKADSDVTKNFPSVQTMLVVRVLLACSVIMTWVYLQQVARKYLRSLVMPFVRRRALTPQESYHMSGCEIAAFTSVQFGTTLVLGICIQDLGLPMALTGVFAQSLAAFVIPPALLLTSLRRGNDLGYSRPAQAYFGAILLFGLVSCTLGVQSTLKQYDVL